MINAERITRTDKSGNAFEIDVGCPGDLLSLLEMYRLFHPKPASQGLPPEDPETCDNWVMNLCEIGENLLARKGKRVVGHAVLIPDVKGRSGEFVIFVEQNHRNLGIGTELTRFTLERSTHLGFDSVWLTVNISNVAAVKLYRKLGFEYSDWDGYERMMRVKLG
jgi:RimJ/RimL family protein N-acetyltransferase